MWYIWIKSPKFAHMIELAQHIEVLLLENDCVIIPGFGGFVAHYAPAMRVEQENIFLPPTRTIGFNPQLKMNDGILVQSYMAVYDTNFSDATKMVEKEVEELTAKLHEEGRCDLGNVGEIRYTIHNTYEFIPYDNKITTPYLYGLDSFEIKELAALRQSTDNKPVYTLLPKEKKVYEIKINRAYLRNAVAMVAAIALFFFMSTPIENTVIENNNYAQLLPTAFFEKIEKQSVALTPVTIQTIPAKAQETAKERRTSKPVVRPVAVKEVKVPRTVEAVTVPAKAVQQKIEGAYHIIIASVSTPHDAEMMAKDLKAQGFSGAKSLVGDGKVRVSIMSCMTSDEASRQLSKIRENSAYQNAWVLIKK